MLEIEYEHPLTPLPFACRLVVVGYSQGGEIFDDALCGGGSCSIADYNVKAAIFMGAPTYVAGLTYNVGTCAAQGVSRLSVDTVPLCDLAC